MQTPELAEVRDVEPAQLRTLHAERVHPAGAVLVLVGDVEPEQALDAAERALGELERCRARPPQLPPVPPLAPGPLLLVDRPGSVQSSLRIALPAVARTHPDHAALQLANLVFGGYFSSRWVENIREDKGYTYGPHSLVEHSVAGSTLLRRRRGGDRGDRRRRCWRPGTSWAGWRACRRSAEELEQARQYALGTLQLGMSTQAGLAALTSTYAGSRAAAGLPRRARARLATATAEQVARGGDTVPGAGAGGDGGARRRRGGRAAARRAHPGHALGGPVSDPLVPPLARGSLDRAAHRRTDGQWLRRAWQRARVLVVAPVDDGQALVRDAGDPELVLLPAARAPAGAEERRLFLGVESDGTPVFAVDARAAVGAGGPCGGAARGRASASRAGRRAAAPRRWRWSTGTPGTASRR